MEHLLNQIKQVRNSPAKQKIDSQMKSFQNVDDVFSELCFCLLTANFNAAGGIRIQEAIGSGFSNLTEQELAGRLKELGHRYPNARAKYISSARETNWNKALRELDGEELRDWLVRNVKGLGCKEASHFLRNIGYSDFAIIDFHIIDLLVRNELIEKPKTLTRKKYLEIENILRSIAEKSGLSLGELDMYLWYIETGKILK